MTQMPRRLFFLLLGALIPGAISHKAEAAKKKKSTPTPTPKKKKSTPTPTPSKSSKASPSASASPSKTLEGVVIAKSADLALRQSKGVVAFDVRCTHNGVPSSLSGAQLKCPAHGSIFDPETGAVVRGPAVDPLKSYRTVEANGEIRIVIS
jgi:Rieske Fe-S protein